MDVPGFRQRGLVVPSDVADSLQFSQGDSAELKVKALDFIAPPGSEAWAKVMSIKTKADGTYVYALSMKVRDVPSARPAQ